MKPHRLLIVAPRFWPHCGMTELALSDLARNLTNAGHHVTVATMKWSRDWSDEMNWRGIRIVRFARPVNGPWISFRYARSLARHFSAHRYDGVIASGLGDETAAVTSSIDDGTPVIIRMDDGQDGVRGQLHQRHVETVLSADAIVTNSIAVADRFGAVPKMPPPQVIADGIRIKNHSLPTIEHKLHLRRALSNAHPVLRIEPNQPLIVAGVRMNDGCGCAILIKAWSSLLSRFPRARLWLVGDGTHADSIWQQITARDLTHSVVLPGFFDNLDDVMTAADVCLHPRLDNQTGEGLLRAMAVGTPVVACRSTWTQCVISDGFNGRLIPPGSPEAIAHSIEQILDDPNALLQSRRNAIESIASDFRPDDQVQQYLQVLAIHAREAVVAQ